MTALRPVLSLLLSLVLMVTSVTMAVARGDMAAARAGGISVVICAGSEMLTIRLDAQGNPAKPPHPCPDCLALVALAPDSSDTDLRAPLHRSDPLRPRMSRPFVAAAVSRTRARGPPLTV